MKYFLIIVAFFVGGFFLVKYNLPRAPAESKKVFRDFYARKLKDRPREAMQFTAGDLKKSLEDEALAQYEERKRRFNQTDSRQANAELAQQMQAALMNAAGVLELKYSSEQAEGDTVVLEGTAGIGRVGAANEKEKRSFRVKLQKFDDDYKVVEFSEQPETATGP